MIDDRRLRTLAATQRSLVTVDQARDLGYDEAPAPAPVRRRRWERVTPRVARLVGSADTIEQRALIAVLDAGTAALWEGPAQQHGGASRATSSSRFTSFGSATARTRLQRRSAPRAVLLPDNHVVVLDGIPTAGAGPGAVRRRRYAAAGAELPWFVERMERMVDNAWSARLVSGATLHAMLGDLAQRGRAGIRVMRQVLSTRGLDYIPPASNLEARVIKILADGGLPPMRRQVDTGDGRVGSAASTCAIRSSRWSWRSRASGSTPARSIVSSTRVGSSGWSEPAWSSSR